MTVIDAFERYFATGAYARRYPRPNPSTLRAVSHYTPRGGTILDLGAGDGRYAIPLAAAGFRILGVEPAETARRQLELRAHRITAGRVTVFSTLDEVPTSLLEECDLAALLFGVYGHMSYEVRSRALNYLHQALPDGSRILGSVPNRYRRLRTEQHSSTIPDSGLGTRVWFPRSVGKMSLTIEHTVFSPSALRDELAGLGWRSTLIRSESLLPESLVTRRPLVGRVDAMLARIVPSVFGYGLFYVASKCSKIAS